MPFIGGNSREMSLRETQRKYSSPTIYPRYSSSAVVSPTKAFNSQSIKSPPGVEYHRTVSHSPARRLPLSTVQHQSPKKENNVPFPKNEELKSKIPSPASRYVYS